MRRSYGPSAPAHWHRIKIAQMPGEAAAPFHERLAHFCGISYPAAEALEMEYRRFLYLSARVSQRIEPDEQVRMAWTLHARHPEYKAFCRDVLGTDLPYRPIQQDAGYPAARERARFEYTYEFGAEPPAKFWGSNEKLGGKADIWLGILMFGIGAVLVVGARPPWPYLGVAIMLAGTVHTALASGKAFLRNRV